ncbi:glycoside hydrolase family 43 protein [Yinghuangia aomiensis]|uniref:Glycoside hydrolase family 43 protein n=1 Tax=Yinghuangia aomiensis TaxID=676205 RepID=A0ABP9I174_9ACTN
MSTHPILPGFHPDPSVCWAGDAYYLATSSFEYFPGVPLFRSTDLLRWEQVGNVLDRAEQLRVVRGAAAGSTGIFAPTLRFHDGEFWLVTTNLIERAKGHLIVHTTDPGKGWSAPVYTDGAIGIDPDLAWDEQGTCHLTWAHEDGIRQAAVDPRTGHLLSEPRTVWTGTGLAHPEAPHLYARNGWWYLVIAEGGTERGHAVSVARSRSVGGPFDPHPANPVFSHRSTRHPVQNTGHADLVASPDGSWAMVYLGVRPRGSTPGFHVNGRETFLAGVEWVDDWPVVVEDAFGVPPQPTSFVDDFADGVLHPRWISPGVTLDTFVRCEDADAPRDGGVTLRAGRPQGGREPHHLLAVRARDAEWQAKATVPVGDVALVVQIDAEHWVGVERRGDVLTARAVVGPFDQELGAAAGVSAHSPLAIRAVDMSEAYGLHNGPDRLELGYVQDGRFRVLAEMDGRYLSTEVACGFTGRVVGVEALEGDAVLTEFAYDTHLAEPRATSAG